MSSFLEQAATYLLRNYGDDIRDLCIVLPNRRAGLFLRKFIAAGYGRTTWSPAIFSVEDFVAGMSVLQLAEPVRVLAELYKVHKEHEGVKAQPFAEFMEWAPQLLNDFNDLDRYLVDAKSLFSWLDEARAIQLWNPELKPLTDFEKKYLHFYNSLSDYYHGLTSRLLEQKLATSGLIFRIAAENVERDPSASRWKKIIFAGFSAMTKAEEVIIGHFHRTGLAELLWDADHYYLDDDRQEAGDSLRQRFRSWNIREPRWVSDELLKSEKRITIAGIASNVGQARYCGELLSDLVDKGMADERTAVVLPDERLLLPLLNSLPPEIRDLNITMGLPLSYTPLSGLMEAVFRLHGNMGKFQKNRVGKQRFFYFRDVLDVLNHPYIRQMAKALLRENFFLFEETITSFRMGNKIFITREEVTGPGSDLFSGHLAFMDAIFEHWSEPAVALGYMAKIIEGIRDGCILGREEEGMGSYRVELEYLFAFSKIIHQLTGIIRSYDFISDNDTLFRLFRQLTEMTSLPFYGEPLKGIQVMGMLETRTLDFDKVILLSCNEDLLPTGKQANSFIPFDIRREFRMPTYRQRDSVYAYHFYRLLQRMHNGWLVYNTEPGELGGGDKSRFLKQIITELPGSNPGIRIDEVIISDPVRIAAGTPPICIMKTPEIMKLLVERSRKGFSATSLNAYRRCPLNFYFSEIAGIREPEAAEETIDPRVMGEAVHLALKNLFMPFRGKTISREDIAGSREKSDGALDDAFAKIFKGSDVRYGKNLLLAGVAKSLTNRFLRAEEEFAGIQENNLKILDLEKYAEVTIAMVLDGQEIPVRFKGIIDRLDQAEGVVRIIDYKTGSVEPKQMKVPSWEDLSSGKDLDKPFQLLFYAWLLHQKNLIGKSPLAAGIFSLKKMGFGFMPVVTPEQENDGTKGRISRAAINEFGRILDQIIRSILDPGTEFSQTGDLLTCRNCPYINVCGR